MGIRMELTEALRAEYAQLFTKAAIRPEYAATVASVADRIVSPTHRPRYAAVAAATGVPALVVGIIHSLEAGLRFDCHLHNGDPLSARTVHVPAGRPARGEPPFAWEDSAADALCRQGLDRWTDWTQPGLAFVLERYNGWGYRRYHPRVKSPYLWGGTTAYTAGKYVADGTWSDDAVSRQCGGMAVLRRLLETGRADLPGTGAAPATGDGPVAPAPDFPGRVLGEGMRDAAVVAVRRRLAARGFRDVAQGTDRFDAALDAAVRRFQAGARDGAGRPLAVDGLIGRRTWRALFDPQDGPRPSAA